MNFDEMLFKSGAQSDKRKSVQVLPHRFEEEEK